jgi:hypothetical protein
VGLRQGPKCSASSGKAGRRRQPGAWAPVGQPAPGAAPAGAGALCAKWSGGHTSLREVAPGGVPRVAAVRQPRASASAPVVRACAVRHGRAGRRGGRTRQNGGTRPAARGPRPVCPCCVGPSQRLPTGIFPCPAGQPSLSPLTPGAAGGPSLADHPLGTHRFCRGPPFFSGPEHGWGTPEGEVARVASGAPMKPGYRAGASLPACCLHAAAPRWFGKTGKGPAPPGSICGAGAWLTLFMRRAASVPRVGERSPERAARPGIAQGARPQPRARRPGGKRLAQQ